MHQHIHDYDALEPRGLPRWAVWAFAPVALALGIIAGVAASAYLPWPVPAREPAVQAPSAQEPPAAAESPEAPTAPGVDQPEPTGTKPPPAMVSEVAPLLPPAVDDFNSVPAAPATGPAVGEVRTLVDARTALATEFHTFTAGGREWFHVDYQMARDVNYDTMLVGIVKLAEYNNWLTAVRDYRDELTRWLAAAARRVRDAAQSEGFNLTWAVFEVVPDQPYGFLASEVTPLPRGQGYLVTRLLAAVTDFGGPTVTIAAVPGTGPVTGPDPAAVYGPVLRFDSTDLYRPPANAVP